MPRISAESQSAATYRAGIQPAKPPATLSKAASIIWRRIVATKPADWFDPGNELLLEAYCEMAVQARELHAQMAVLRESEEFGDDARKMEKRIGYLSDKMSTAATKLRLSVQHLIANKSGKITERGEPAAANDGLIGGMAVWPGDQRAN